MSKLVSVCMSTYDRDPENLDRVLQSIISQRPPFDFEIIVVDDGSANDVSRDVCEKNFAQYIRIDREPIRRNPCVARNIAYRKAEGSIIVAQSDDVVHITKNSLEILVQELQSGSFVIANVFACGPSGKPWSEYTGLKRQVPYLFLGSLRKSDVYKVGGNDEDFTDIPGCEDEWFAQCLMNGLGLRPKYITSVVGYHLYHECRTTPDIQNLGEELLKKKIDNAKKTGVWCSSSGPWFVEEKSQMEQIFSDLLDKNEWGSLESKSGFGSSHEATLPLRNGIYSLLKLYSIKSLLDIPCGDFNWMNLIDLDGIGYIGGDVVEELIESNKKNYNRDFVHLDITSSPLPQVDLIICRDCFGHLSFNHCKQAVENIKKSGSKYLLTTTFPGRSNLDINTGSWTTRCMTSSPFNFPPAMLTIDELCTEHYPHFADKSMSLWKVSDL